MALYRFLFAPVLLAVAVLTTSPRRAQQPPAPRAPVHAAEAPVMKPAPPARSIDSRAGRSHPGTVR